MKWYKHISDSLDDPMIFDLMTEFGSDAYLVFFGVLEKYSREFSPENGWNLVINPSFFRQKFRISQNKIKKILSKIYKWEVSYESDKVRIFIPKFTQLIDNYTRNTNPIKEEKACKLIASDSQETFQPIKNKEQRSKNNIPPISPKGGVTFTDDFISFWKSYPKKTGKKAAWKAWKAARDKPPLSEILAAISRQRQTEQWQKENGQYIPNPATWINQGRWADEVETEPESSIDAWARRKQAELEAAKNGTV